MDSFMGWMFVIFILGAIFLRRRIGDWRRKASDAAVRNWFGAGFIGFFAFYFGMLGVDAGGQQGMLAFLAAGLAWIAIITGSEVLARDTRNRATQQRTWEERMRLSVKRSDSSQGQPDPELSELLRLELEQSRVKPVRKPFAGVLPTPFAVEQDTADTGGTEGSTQAAAVGPERATDLTELFFPKHKPVETHAPDAAHATATLPVEAQPAITRAHGGVAANVHLGVQSRFGSGAPAATVRTSQSVRPTAPMDAAPTISASATQMPQTTVSAAVPDAIALPVTAMPASTPVSTTPGAVQASSAPRVLGPTTLGSSGRFSYQPKLVQSRLGAGSTSVEKTAGGASTKSS